MSNRITRSGAGPSRSRGDEILQGSRDAREVLARKKAERGKKVNLRGAIKLELISQRMRELVNSRDENGVPVNTESTFKAKIGSVRTLIRKYLTLKEGVGNPTSVQISQTDLKNIIKPPGADFLQLLAEVWPNESTRITVLGYLVSVIDNVQPHNFGLSDRDYEVIYDHMLQGAQRRNRARSNNEAPEVIRDNPNVTKWERFIDFEKQMRDDDYGSMDHLGLAIRVLFSPRRDADFSLLKFCNRLPVLNEDNDKFNWCEVPQDESQPVKLDFRAYKTVRSFGRQNFHLSADSEYADVAPELVELGKIIRKNRERFPRTFVFPAVSRDEFSSTRVASQLKDVVSKVTDGVVFGVRILRKVYSTYTARVFGNNAIKRQHVAYLLAHSVAMNMTYGYREEDDVPEAAQEDVSQLRDRLSELERKTSEQARDVNKFRAAIGGAVSMLNSALGPEFDVEESVLNHARETLKTVKDLLRVSDIENSKSLVTDLISLLRT